MRSTLKWTNTFRAIHGAPPVTWSWKAWENAALAAEACRERQELFHSNHRGYGQNGYACAVRQVDGPVPLKELMSVEDWTGTGPGDDQNSPEVAIRCWYDEHRNYDWHEPGSSRSGVVSHFTQLVWAKTRKVGLARSSCGTFLMMNFDPPGNIIGVNTYSRNVRPIDRSKQEAFWMEEEARAAAVAAKDAVAIEAAKKSRAAKVAKGVLEHEKRSERAGRWAEIHQRVSRAEAAAASDARLSIELMQARARRSKAELDEADRALQQAQAAQQAAKARYDRDARELAGEVRLAERRLRCHIGLLERKEELLPCTEAELDQGVDEEEEEQQQQQQQQQEEEQQGRREDRKKAAGGGGGGGGGAAEMTWTVVGDGLGWAQSPTNSTCSDGGGGGGGSPVATPGDVSGAMSSPATAPLLRTPQRRRGQNQAGSRAVSSDETRLRQRQARRNSTSGSNANGGGGGRSGGTVLLHRRKVGPSCLRLVGLTGLTPELEEILDEFEKLTPSAARYAKEQVHDFFQQKKRRDNHSPAAEQGDGGSMAGRSGVHVESGHPSRSSAPPGSGSSPAATSAAAGWKRTVDVLVEISPHPTAAAAAAAAAATRRP